MACERFRDALTDVAAGAPATGVLEAHLGVCEACRVELDALRQALAVADAEMAGLSAAGPSPGLTARIRAALAEEEPSAAWRFGWLWPATAAAATLLVALAVWVGRGPSPGPRVAVDTGAAPSATTAPITPAATASAPGGGVVTPRSAGPAERREVRRAGGSLGTRLVGAPRDSSEPGVLVPPGEEQGLLRFAAEVRHRPIAPDSFLVADLSTPLSEPKAIEIAPLEIVPLDPETSGTD